MNTGLRVFSRLKKATPKKSKKTISGTINKLDSKISKYGTINKPVIQVREIEKVDAVDLDELFKEQNKNGADSKTIIDNNDNLEDFLADFDLCKALALDIIFEFIAHH